MKDYLGTDLKRYTKQELSGIHAAVGYQLLLNKIYLAWNITFMLSGVAFVYMNANWFTTYEILGFLALFWGVSGLPFFLLIDQVKRKFAAQLPAGKISVPSAPVELLKLLAGFAIGAWATHVMLIAASVKNFEIRDYLKKTQAAYEAAA